ncbi:MAG: hypothetical protein ACLVI4_11375 [Anaerovoracaceae bacterium]
MRNSKVRGQKRRLNSLLNNIDKIQPSFDYIGNMNIFMYLVDGGYQNLKRVVELKLNFVKNG